MANDEAEDNYGDYYEVVSKLDFFFKIKLSPQQALEAYRVVRC
jgi:hypothetical protein